MRLEVLPEAEDVNRERLRRHGTDLLAALQRLGAPLPAETERGLRDLLRDGGKDDEAFAAAVQKLLDPQCLVAVSINPESRIKALRGPSGKNSSHWRRFSPATTPTSR